ncbi:MAG TPA: nuclear transport factor 2 family protein [Longimicrobiales bacterium]|nr:nuclear transport factor 2 family protein [Longimicrobiales bacterium]
MLAASLVLAGCGDRTPIPLDGSLPEAPAAAELEGALLASAEAWNREDLDAFMAPYLRSPGLTFSGSGGVRRGFDAVMRRYRESYFEAEVPLPRLRFEDLESLDLGRDHALMLGRYVLLAADTGNRVDTGHFSLVWVRTVDGWRIMHDHTTVAEN